MEAPRIPRRLWLWAVVLGLTGQLTWTIENMYLNVFVYETITDNPAVLATLVAASAFAATVATFLAGAWSDRTGRRKRFIALGYIAWGLSTAAFGLVDVGFLHRLAPAADAVVLAVIAIVLIDCVMSALGATANDAAFNAWVTDSTDEHNRGRIDGVLSTFPLLAMLIVFGALDPLTQQGQWRTFFGILGAMTVLVGLAALVWLRDAGSPRPSGSYLSTVINGLRPTSVRANPRLYLTLAAWAVLGSSTQVFIPYLIIYVTRFLRIDNYPIVLAATLIGAAVVGVLGGRVIDRVGADRTLLPAMGCYVVGLLAMFIARNPLTVIASGIVVLGFFMVGGAALAVAVRNLTPPRRAGEVQGLRMIAMVLIPMLVGPWIGAAVISGAAETYVELGVVRQVPTPWIFPAAAAVAVLILIPARLLRRTPTPDLMESR